MEMHGGSNCPAQDSKEGSRMQIRYLHKKFAEFWSVPSLAEGFDVSTMGEKGFKKQVCSHIGAKSEAGS